LRSEGLWFLASLGKKLARPYVNEKKLGMITHACYPSYGGKHEIESDPGQPEQKAKLYLKISQSKMGWRQASSGRAPL
jgi:hypothetical protein